MLRDLRNTLSATAAAIKSFFSWGPSPIDQFWNQIELIDVEAYARKMRVATESDRIVRSGMGNVHGLPMDITLKLLRDPNAPPITKADYDWPAAPITDTSGIDALKEMAERDGAALDNAFATIAVGSIKTPDGLMTLDLAGGKLEMIDISKRAAKLLKRLRAGEYYTVYDRNGLNKRTPKAMQELVDIGLVVTSMRVETVVQCYVPKGFIPHKPEEFPS